MRYWSIAALLTLAAMAVLYAFPPETSSFYPRCTFHLVTGLHCPGCGSTRAVHELLHGNFAGAFRHNALLFVLLPAVFFGLIQTKRTGCSWLQQRFAGWAIGILLLGFAVLRNLPMAPFHHLAP